MHVPFMGEAAGMKQMLVWSLYPCLLILSPSFFPPWYSSHRGEGDRERLGSVVRSVSLATPAPPTSAEALHTATAARALSNGASATEPRQQSSTATACRVSPQWSCHWADRCSGTTPRADRDLTDRN